MSLPNQQHTVSPPLSSKKSIRAPGPSPSSRPPTSHPEEQTYREEEGTPPQRYDNNKSITHRQQPLQPFFTLIEDANTGEYHHPSVHYIFSDDDTDILTEAVVRSIEAEQGNAVAAGKKPKTDNRRGQGEHEQDASYNEEDELRKESLLPPPTPGVRDNYVILDVEPISEAAQKTGDTNLGPNTDTKSLSTSAATNPTVQPKQQQPQFTISSARSLTPTWQVLNTELVPAPTFENNTSPTDQKQPLNGGLMLKIHGTPGLPPTMFGKYRENKERGSHRLEDMMDQFAKRMNELRVVIETGEQIQDSREQDGSGEYENDTNMAAGTAEDQEGGNKQDAA